MIRGRIALVTILLLATAAPAAAISPGRACKTACRAAIVLCFDNCGAQQVRGCKRVVQRHFLRAAVYTSEGSLWGIGQPRAIRPRLSLLLRST